MRVIIAPLQSTKDNRTAIHLPATSRKAPIPLEIRMRIPNPTVLFSFSHIHTFAKLKKRRG